jgi:hypothetical protein
MGAEEEMKIAEEAFLISGNFLLHLVLTWAVNYLQ